MKILKAIVSILCTIILSISLLVLSGLLLIRGTFNKDNLINIIMPSKTEETGYITQKTEIAYVSSSEIAYSEADIEGMDYDKLQSLAGDTNKIHEILDSTFTEQGLPVEIIDYIIEDADYQDVLGSYLNDYLNYTMGNGPKPTINQTKINEILNKNITIYEKENNVEINTEKLEEMVTKMSEEIDSHVDSITSNDTIKTVLNVIFSKKLLIGLIINCLVWLTIIIIINLNKNITYYLGATALIHGMFYAGVKIVLPKLASAITAYQSIINSIIDIITPRINIYAILSFIVAIVLFGVGITLTILDKKKKNEVETN